MRIVLELNIEANVPMEHLQDIADRAMAAISGVGGPTVYPRLLLELGPNYLEIPIGRTRKSKSVETEGR